MDTSSDQPIDVNKMFLKEPANRNSIQIDPNYDNHDHLLIQTDDEEQYNDLEKHFPLNSNNIV